MTAECFNCAAGIGAIPGIPSGVSTNPRMVCKLCGALNCGRHGQRDPNVPACVGVECDPSLLVASAAATSPSPAAAQVAEQVGAGIPAAYLVHDLDEFLRRRPLYRSWLGGAVAEAGRGVVDRTAETVHPLWESASAPGQELLLAASVLAGRLPADATHPLIRDILDGGLR